MASFTCAHLLMFNLIESKMAQFCKSVTEVDWDKDRWCLLRFPNSHATILSVQIFQTAILSVPEIVFKLQFCHGQLFQTAISVQILYDQNILCADILNYNIVCANIVCAAHWRTGRVRHYIFAAMTFDAFHAFLLDSYMRKEILGWFNHSVLLTSYSALFD